jgi:hypothetical protein
LGKVALALADDVGAQAYLTQALQREWSLRHVAPAIGALVALAELRIRQGHVEEAIGLLGMALHHPAIGKDSKALAQRLLTELQGQLSAEHIASALERGKNANFDEVVEGLLRQAPFHA